ncbi:TPA: LPXTG cell wall anchor domain-containing protein [Enterococcus faecalis]
MKIKKWKKRLSSLGMVTAFGLASLGAFFIDNPLAEALTIPKGMTEVGKINNAPVLKAPTNDMDDPWFQALTQNLFEAIGTPSYVVKQVGWGKDTTLYNGKDLSSYGRTASAVFEADGYLPTDKGINLHVGQSAYIQNVGSVIKTATGEEIPISMEVKLESVQGFGSQSDPLQELDSALLMAKSQNTVLTLGWGTLSQGGSEGGGQSEGGGIGGDVSDGSSMMFIDNVKYSVMLIDSKTGNPLPQNDVLMPIKMSDIDASQLATMGGEGAFGYVLSPDTKLSISGNGMVSAPGGAINNDTTQLSANSYLVLKKWNKNFVGYKYTDGLNNHMDIVTGIFGFIPSWKVGGYLEIDKSTLQFGKTPWNKHYSFDSLAFDVLNSQGKVVDTIHLDKKGKGKSKYLPIGNYTLREKATNWASSGQTVHADVSTTVGAGKTTQVTIKNTAVTGEITLKKRGVESGTTPWNNHYSLAGNTFKATAKETGKTYSLTTDKTGTARLSNLPLDIYHIEEIKASDGFVNTFKPVDVTLTYKDNKTTVVYGEASGTNQEVKGENILQKVDKETGLDQNGRAVMKDAKYQLFYNEDSNGSSAHKANEPVKWTDTPKPTLLKGEKVTEAIIGGQKVSFGEAVVVDVDDTTLQAGVGNLAVGKYYWKEVDAGEGYVTDPDKHTFEIQKADDKTAVIHTPDTRSEEQVIKAKITLDKSLTLPNHQGGSGFNFIEFTATPLEGTNAEPVTFKTGVNPTTGEDGYAEGFLVYGDWKLEETKGQDGYEDVAPVYIHMETDAKTDRLTISASHNPDFSEPFSKRIFTLKDSAETSNPNNEETVGEVDAQTPTISLSKIRFNDHPIVPKDPEKPRKDVTKTDGGDSINGGNVALHSNFVYVLTSSVQPDKRKDLQKWTILDDFDETVDRFNGTFKVYATTDFDTYKVGDVLPSEWFSAEEKDGTVLFTAQKAFLDVVNAHKDQTVGFSLHADFYRYKASEKVVNVFDETVNDTTEKSNEVTTKTPRPFPHKFDLSKEKVDLTGEKLLDNDDELDDRYKDTNNDPYVDDPTNNDKENINTQKVPIGQTLVYQLWLDTTPFDETSRLTALSMVDTYDNKALDVNVDKVRVYNKKGNDVTKYFTIKVEKGTLTVSANAFVKAKNTKGKTVKIIDTKKVPMNQVYKIDVPATVKKDVKVGTDIVNMAAQHWTDTDQVSDSHVTEKRVNKVEKTNEPKTPLHPQPHKFVLSKERVDLTGNKLLDDDSELKDRYGETNKDPYVDQVKNNEKENINTQDVKVGQTLVYQLWLDTTPFDKNSPLTALTMVDTYDSESVSVDPKQVKVYDAKGNDVTKFFTVKDEKGTLMISANVFVAAKNAKGKTVKVIDTKKVPMGQIYKIDAPMTVKKDVKTGKDIVNTAKQESVDSEGTKISQQTEKRVNKVPSAVEKVVKGVLPYTGESPSSRLVKVIGWLLLFGLVVIWKRDTPLRKYRRIYRQFRK